MRVTLEGKRENVANLFASLMESDLYVPRRYLPGSTPCQVCPCQPSTVLFQGFRGHIQV